MDADIKGEGRKIVDDGGIGDAGGGGGAGVQRIAHVVVLLDDRAVDGGGDGVVLQPVPGVLEGELGVFHLDGRALDLGGHVSLVKAADDLVLGDPVPLLDAQAGELAGGLGDHLLALPVSKSAAGRTGRRPHRGGTAGGVGQGAGIPDRHGDIAHQGAAGPHRVGGGNGVDDAGEGLQRAVHRDGGGLPHGKAGGIGGVEGDGQLHVVPVQNVGDGGAQRDHIPLVHIQLGDHAGSGGPHGGVLPVVGLVFEELVVAQPGGLQTQLRLLDGGLHILGVDAEQEVALMYRLPLLEGGFQHLPLYQGGDLVGVDGLDGAGAGDGHHQVLSSGGGGEIRTGDDGVFRPAAAPEEEEHQRRQHGQNDHTLNPFFLLAGHRHLGGRALLLLLRGGGL